MNDTERRASDVIGASPWNLTSDQLAAKLSAAGLLVTPLHERALSACKEYARVVRLGDPVVIAVGCEALEAEKPKKRWTLDTSGMMVKYTVLLDGAYYASFCNEGDARAYADQKNREEAK